jgi:hypothetical protein
MSILFLNPSKGDIVLAFVDTTYTTNATAKTKRRHPRKDTQIISISS